MKRLLLAAALTMVAALPSLAFQRLAVGDSVADFSLVGFQGEIVHLADVKGQKATVLAFWATWSPRSIEALADLQKLFQDRGPDNFRVIAINEEHETWESGEFDRVSAAIDRLGLSFSVVADLDLSLYEKFGVSVLPSLVVLDRDGKVLATLASYPEHLRADFYEHVLRALGTPPG